MRVWPSFGLNDLDSVIDLLRYAVKERRKDVNDWDNLKNIFMSGRKVGKIPSGSGDISDGDRVGDFNYDDSFFYVCVDIGGTAAWRRAEMGAW